MAIKIAFINNKGGSAKTTTLVNIAGCISVRYPEKKILIIEGDAQGNTSTSFNLEVRDFDNTIYDVFMGNMPAKEVIINAYENIDIIPANMDMNFLEFDIMENYDQGYNQKVYELVTQLAKQNVDIEALTFETFNQLVSKIDSPSNNYFNMLEGKLDEVEDDYDIILFDTPPELKAVTSSILAVVDKAIIPFEPDKYSLEGIVNILSRIVTIKSEYNESLVVGGILATKVLARTTLHRDIRSRVKAFCKENNIRYFDTEIASSIRFGSSTAYKGLPATISVPNNPFAQAYYKLFDEMLKEKIIELGDK